MKNIKACLSHNSDNWKTPKKLYDFFINHLGCVDCFPYCSIYDQYEKQYEKQLLFINPPYSHLRKVKFFNYIKSLLDNNNQIFLLIPVRTDTRFFKSIFPYISEIYFFTGRLHFNDGASAPFPSMLVFLYHSSSYLGDFRQFTMTTLEDFICERFVKNGSFNSKK